MAENVIRAVLIENQEIVRLGIRAVLLSMHDVVIAGEFDEGQAAVAGCPKLQPDLIVLNVALPGLDGNQVTAQLKQTTAAKVVVVTSHQDSRDVFAALRAGVDAYCLQATTPTRLVDVIRCVMEGGLWLDAAAARALVRECGSSSAIQGKPKSVVSPLTGRELEVLQLVVDGYTNQQIAERLSLSGETVKTHMRHVMDKLCVADRTEAAVRALNEGIVQKRDFGCNQHVDMAPEAIKNPGAK